MSRPAKGVEAARVMFRRLSQAHPDAHCELVHDSAFQLVVATVLSAQSTDVAVNKATPALFQRYGTPAALAAADPEDVQRLVGSLGMFRQKAKNIIGLAKRLVEKHGGEVPRSLAELVQLPGVGRKTANVVLGVAFQAPEGVVVDTHVQRLTQRLGWTKETTPETIEQEMMSVFPREDWDLLSHVLIFHGRRVCFARKPACVTCTVNDACPSAFHAEEVGRKNGPTRTRNTATPARSGASSSSAKSAPSRANTPSRAKAPRKDAARGASAGAPQKGAANKKTLPLAKPARRVVSSASQPGASVKKSAAPSKSLRTTPPQRQK